MLLTAGSALAASVREFSPSGLVKAPRQVRARFSEAMVALGDPRAPLPFTVTCPEGGSARWLDSRTWVYDFARELPGGIACRFTLIPNLRSLQGTAVEPGEFTFSTGGPAITWYRPSWGEIEEQAIVLLALDAEPEPNSILEHVYFSADGVGERIGVRLVDGDERAAILATLDAESRTSQPLVLVQPRQVLPPAAKVRLVWGAGVRSLSGQVNPADHILDFETRAPFRATFSCTRDNAAAACNPLRPLSLSFAAAVAWDLAKSIELRGPEGKTWHPALPAYGGSAVESVQFRGPLPEKTNLEIVLPAGLMDDSGRALANADSFPLQAATAAYPPLAKFAARFGILESGDSVLPVTLRHVEASLAADVLRTTEERDTSLTARMQRAFDRLRGTAQHISPAEIDRIVPWLRRLAVTPREQSIFAGELPTMQAAPTTLAVPRTTGITETEVIGIPLGSPGLYLVEIESPALGAALLGKPAPMYVPTAALVTDLAVHLKRGPQGSLIWVTHLANASPAAEVEVFVLDCDGKTLWTGHTDTEGRATPNGLPNPGDEPRCNYEIPNEEYWSNDYRALQGMQGGLLVVARTSEDISFTHSGWDDGIEPWRFQVPFGYGDTNPLTVHTILDRSLFRAGETVHMKHMVRRRALAGLEIPAADQLPTAGRIVHLGTMEETPLAPSFDASGAASESWTIPQQARLGTYAVRLGNDAFAPTSAQFRVEEFRVPSMTATLSFPDAPRVQPQAIDVDLGVRYLSGGPAVQLPVTLRTQIREHSFSPGPPFEGLTFANGPVTVGIERSGTPESETHPSKPAQRLDLTLDAAGAARAHLADLEPVVRPSELVAELGFRDAIGSEQNVSRTLPLWPAQHLVAISAEDWVASPKEIRIRTAVVDTSGKPVAGARVLVEAFRRQSTSYRKRVVGGFYAYESTTQTEGPLATFCSGVTESSGQFVCAAPLELSGNIVLQASVTDPDGRTSAAHADVWVVSGEHWWFSLSDSDRMDLVPERFAYEPGETARLQVRSPFQEATALVTIERDGIIESFVTQLSGKNPVIEVPLRRVHAPNVFVSVLAVRGRIANVTPTAMLDLGKPAYKLGLTELQVGWREHRLEVAVAPEHETYRVRDTAVVQLNVKSADGSPLPAGTELAVAAVDEGLLELAANPTWDVLTAMMERRTHGIFTATAQGQVVGKRHFGRKALPTGGGGGMQSTRELFDTLLFWEPRVAVDGAGHARVAIPLNDSLTGFRIVAVATSGVDRFGHGSATIRTTQEIHLTSGVPSFVRHGDRFHAEVTVRNATQTAQSVVVRGQIEETSTALAPQNLELAAGAAQVVRWPVTAPSGLERLTYVFEAGEADARDRLRISQSLVPAVATTTLQSSLHQLDGPLQQTVALPKDAVGGMGGLHLTFAGGFEAALGGVRQYMSAYPYTCLEQRVSRAVALGDRAAWEQVVTALATHRDEQGLLSFFPRLEHGSVELTAYVVALAHAAGLPMPQSDLDSALAALTRFVDGGLAVDEATGAGGLALLKLTALEALARHGKVEASQLDSLTFEPELWPTASVIDAWSLYVRQSSLPDAKQRRAACERILKSRLRTQGTTLDFAAASGGAGILACPDASLLRVVLHLAEHDLWPDDLLPAVRGSVARQQRGHWDCTTSNAWGALALERYAERRGGGSVEGTTNVGLAAATAPVAWTSSKPMPEMLDLPWPTKPMPLSLEHVGTGKPIVTIASRAALPLREPLFASFVVHKTIEPLERKHPDRHSVGDLWRVRLDIESQSDATWVVVDDPLPAGASHLGTGLARDSQLAAGASDERSDDWWKDPTFVERRQQSYRAYFASVREGSLQLEYRIRLDQEGVFALPPTHVEAMYEPDRFALLPNAEVSVGP